MDELKEIIDGSSTENKDGPTKGFKTAYKGDNAETQAYCETNTMYTGYASGVELSKREKKKTDIVEEIKENSNSALKSLTLVESEDAAVYPFHTISPAISSALPSSNIDIMAAPTPQAPPRMNWFSVLATPVGMIIVMLIVFLIMGTSSLSSFIFMVPMSLIGVVTAVVNYHSQKKDIGRTQTDLNDKYLSYLSDVENEIAEIKAKQQDVQNSTDPSVKYCASMDENSIELWNRGVNNKKFMSVRVGVGDAPLCVGIKAPEKTYDRDIPLEERARVIAENSKIVSNIPVTLDLKSHPTVGIVGKRNDIISHALSLIVNATALHSYEDLKLVIIYPKEEDIIWSEARWLPHVFDEKRKNRYIAATVADGKSLLNELVKTIDERVNSNAKSPWASSRAVPHFLFVIADMNCIKGSTISHYLTLNDPTISISTVFLSSEISSLPQNCQCIIETTEQSAELYTTTAYDQRVSFVPDSIDKGQFAKYCRTMAPIRIDGEKKSSDIVPFIDFLTAWKVDAPEKLPIKDFWKDSLPSDSMQVPLGAASGGTIFFFDDHQNMHGVHGIYVGTNGSGKSSMIRSWILSMAVQFSPEYVNFVLVDFKGSGLLDGLENLPHVVGTISNLDSDIRRNLIALESEIERREAFFKETGGNIYSCYKSGNTKMPFLYIIIDELNEFKLWSNSGDDNRMKLLDRLAQVGRALGIQLIAGSQTTAPFTDTMEKNARFRWCLKTATAEDSMYLLKTDDAFNITEKGRAIVRVGSNEVYEEVQPIFSDGPYYTPAELSAMPEREMALLNLQGIHTKVTVEDHTGKQTQLDAVVSYVRRIAEEILFKSPTPIWPERLPNTISLKDLTCPYDGELIFSIGLVDDPRGQKQYTLQIDLEKNGHVVVYGAPRTGKTTFLQTAALSLLSHCSPEDIEVYTLGSGLKVFADCPQVIKSVDSFSPKPVIAAVHNALMNRKKTGVDSSDRPIILFVDGIGEIMVDFRTELTNIAQYGAGCKIYLIASASKQGDVAPISAYLTHGYALWFADNLFDYRTVLAEKSVDKVPAKDIVGRGVFYNNRTLEFQTALPSLTDAEFEDRLADIREKYFSRAATKVKPLLSVGDVIIGEGKESGCSVVHNFRDNSSMLLLGNNIDKRNALLRYYCCQMHNQPDIYKTIGIDVDPEMCRDISNMVFLQSGYEVDEYLAGMFDEVKKRSELQKQDGTLQFPKFVFVVSDWKKCIDNITELSKKRFAINILQKGKILGIQLIAGCSYEDYKTEFENDSVGATQLLGTGSALFVGYMGNGIPACYISQVKKAEKNYGDIYVTSDSAEQIEFLEER